MKNEILGLIFLLLLGVVSCNQHNEQITGMSLPEMWRFKPGDDMSYLITGLDDSGWKEIKTGQTWDKQGYKNLDGFAW
jgi:hypothetical protein